MIFFNYKGKCKKCMNDRFKMHCSVEMVFYNKLAYCKNGGFLDTSFYSVVNKISFFCTPQSFIVN
jgi:hypothetical protein